VDRLCGVSMPHVCTHTSESSTWKAYVSGRQWLNDSTYWPNSHSGSCAYLKKNNMRGNPTNRESVVSVRLEVNAPKVHVWPPLILPLGQNRNIFRLLTYRHHLACFHICHSKGETFQKRTFFNPNRLLSYLWTELQPEMVHVRKGVVWPENIWGEGGISGHEGGERLKQERAELCTSFHSCVFIWACCVSQETSPTVSMKTFSSSMVNMKRTINNARE